MISEVDVAKKCYQIWHKVAKVPKKCYQMWQNVTKGVPRGFKGFQGVPRESDTRTPKGFQGKVLPDVGKGVPKVVQGYPTLFAKVHRLERLRASTAGAPCAAGAP